MQQQSKEKQSGERESYVRGVVEEVRKRDGLSSTIYGVDLCQCKRLEEAEQCEGGGMCKGMSTALRGAFNHNSNYQAPRGN